MQRTVRTGLDDALSRVGCSVLADSRAFLSLHQDGPVPIVAIHGVHGPVGYVCIGRDAGTLHWVGAPGQSVWQLELANAPGASISYLDYAVGWCARHWAFRPDNPVVTSFATA